MALNLQGREEYVKKKRYRRRIKYGIFIALFLLTIGILSFVSYRPSLRINNVELTGGELLTQDEIQTATLNYLKGSYFFLFPRNNSLLYSKNNISDYLKESFKRIDTISIKNKNFHTMLVSISERKPFAIWCDKLPGDNTPKMEDGSDYVHCYFMDQNSTIFSEAPEFSGDAYFKYYGLIATDTPIGTEYIASTTEFGEISNFVSQIKNLGVKPQYLYAKDKNNFSIVVGGGGEIYFNVDGPMDKMVDNLATVIKSKEFGGASPGNLPIQYIDLRYGNKLFYKLK